MADGGGLGADFGGGGGGGTRFGGGGGGAFFGGGGLGRLPGGGGGGGRPAGGRTIAVVLAMFIRMVLCVLLRVNQQNCSIDRSVRVQ